MPVSENEPDNRSRLEAFVQTLNQLVSADGRQVQVEVRWGKADPIEIRRLADEVARAPDVIVASGDLTAGPTLRETSTIPVIFNNVTDPVGAGFVESLAYPGGNATGFLRFEYTLAGKWLELLKLIAPRVTHAAVLRDADTAGGVGQFAVIQSLAPSLSIHVRAISLRDAREIERAVTSFARRPNGGLIITASAPSVTYRDLIIALASQYKLPAVYYRRSFVAAGGLISYGYDLVPQFRNTAGYVNRILKGEKASDLPVQHLRSTTLLSILRRLKPSILPSLLARADEVVE